MDKISSKYGYLDIGGVKIMKERIVEERKTKYGKRVVKQIKGRIIVEKIIEDTEKVVEKAIKKRGKGRRSTGKYKVRGKSKPKESA